MLSVYDHLNVLDQCILPDKDFLSCCFVVLHHFVHFILVFPFVDLVDDQHPSLQQRNQKIKKHTSYL